MTSPPALESVAYLEHLVACNQAVSDFLGVPLDPVDGASKYQRASKALSDPTVWPDDARAKTAKYKIQFPWLLALFVAGKPGARCPVWEQTAELLADHDKFLDRLTERTRSWAHRTRAKTALKKAVRAALGRRSEVKDEFSYVAWEMARIVIGKAAEWLAKWNAKVAKGEVKSGESWLDAALDFGRGDFVRPVREEETGQKRAPERDGTTATADPLPGKPAASKPTVKLQTDLKHHEDESRTERTPSTDNKEQPEVIAETGERDGVIVAALGKLTQDERVVVTLHYWEGLSFPEIDSRKEWKADTASKHWKSAKAKLKTAIPRDFHE